MSASNPAGGRPDGGAADQQWSGTRERSNIVAVRLMAWIAIHLGRRAARLLLHPITLYFLCLAPQPRRNSARYLARALGRRPRLADRYRHLHSFAAVVLDRVYFVSGRMSNFELTLDGNEWVDRALASGRGAFLLGAHLGSFEALHAVGVERRLPVAMAMFPHNARTIHRVLQAIAPDFELGVIPIGSSGSTLAIRDHLDGGGLVGLLGDRLPPVENLRHAVTELPFLGSPARFSDGPLRLAMLLRRPVIFMCGLYRGGKRYEVRFAQLADFSQPPADPAGRDHLLQQALQDYVARLEALCREAPYNWFNFYDFWREDRAH